MEIRLSMTKNPKTQSEWKQTSWYPGPNLKFISLNPEDKAPLPRTTLAEIWFPLRLRLVGVLLKIWEDLRIRKPIQNQSKHREILDPISKLFLNEYHKASLEAFSCQNPVPFLLLWNAFWVSLYYKSTTPMYPRKKSNSRNSSTELA